MTTRGLIHNFTTLLLIAIALPAAAQVNCAWLTHKRSDSSHIVVNWETKEPSRSVLEYGRTAALGERVEVGEAVVLHHVEVPFPKSGDFHYRISSDGHPPFSGRVKSYSGDVLRVVLASNWQARPALECMLAEDAHLLVTCGDHVSTIIDAENPGNKANTKPFSDLVVAYQDIFRSMPVMPALGNHDRQFRPRGKRFPPEVTYDVDATAFLDFFPLPGDGWKWAFEIPEFDVQFVALDFNHTSDFGTTWQSCHGFDAKSEQWNWYKELMEPSDRRFVVTVYNEMNRTMRGHGGGIWGSLFEKGTMAITGFGHFAERAEVQGFPYFNTALGTGTRYADPKARFFAVTPSYMLLTFRKGAPSVTVEIKDLEGVVLDKTSWPVGSDNNLQP